MNDDIFIKGIVTPQIERRIADLIDESIDDIVAGVMSCATLARAIAVKLSEEVDFG